MAAVPSPLEVVVTQPAGHTQEIRGDREAGEGLVAVLLWWCGNGRKTRWRCWLWRRCRHRNAPPAPATTAAGSAWQEGNTAAASAGAAAALFGGPVRDQDIPTRTVSFLETRLRLRSLLEFIPEVFQRRSFIPTSLLVGHHQIAGDFIVLRRGQLRLRLDNSRSHLCVELRVAPCQAHEKEKASREGQGSLQENGNRIHGVVDGAWARSTQAQFTPSAK